MTIKYFYPQIFCYKFFLDFLHIVKLMKIFFDLQLETHVDNFFCLCTYNIISIMIIVVVYMNYGVKILSTNICHFHTLFFRHKLFSSFLPRDLTRNSCLYVFIKHNSFLIYFFKCWCQMIPQLVVVAIDCVRVMSWHCIVNFCSNHLN